MSVTTLPYRYVALRITDSVEYLQCPEYPAMDLPLEAAPDVAASVLEAKKLVEAYEETAAIENIDKAIAVLRRIQSDMPYNHPHLTAILTSCEVLLRARFVYTGEIRGSELYAGLKIAERIVKVANEEHSCQAAGIINLGTWLGRQFDRDRNMKDIDRAILTCRMATELQYAGDSAIANGFNNMAYWLMRRFDHTQDAKDLDSAVEVSRSAERLTPDGDSLKALRQSNLTTHLLRRVEQTAKAEDVVTAIKFAKLAAQAPGVLEADRPLLLGNVGNAYLARFKLGRQLSREDINMAIHYLHQAVVAASTSNHPNHADLQLRLGECLKERYHMKGGLDREDLDDAFNAFEKGLGCSLGRTEACIFLAQQAASICAIKRDWPKCSSFLDKAVRLLHFVTLPSQSESARQRALGRFHSLAAEAAAAALEAGKSPYHALNVLESGRSFTNDFSFDVYSFIDAECSELEGFVNKRDRLDSLVRCYSFPATVATRSLLEAQIEAERTVRHEANSLLLKIREIPKFHSFLQLHSLNDLITEAQEAPIVVLNAAKYRCDAFIIDGSGVSALWLDELSLDEIKHQSRDLAIRTASVLDWLWNSTARPILDKLGFRTATSNGDFPRVFWVLPGAMSSLPIHAAGIHIAGSTETVIDRAMSSYSSSVKSLIYGRRKARVEFGSPGSDTALLVSMDETEGLQPLPFAPIEIDKVKELCHSLGIDPVVQSLPDYSDLRKHFFKTKIFHFAGHALSHALDPLVSCLCLRDWKQTPLTVDRLSHDFKVKTHNPFLAYLAACSTGTIREQQLVDEGMHLVAVYQLSGFRHVIGSLSPVSDQHCVDVAAMVYEFFQGHGITDRSVCQGLHCALRALRDESYRELKRDSDGKSREIRHAAVIDDDYIETLDKFFWVPYVHFGV